MSPQSPSEVSCSPLLSPTSRNICAQQHSDKVCYTIYLNVFSICMNKGHHTVVIFNFVIFVLYLLMNKHVHTYICLI